MPRRASAGGNATPQKWGNRPPISFPSVKSLYLPTSNSYLYLSDAPRPMSRAEANSIRRVANQFGVTLRGIAPGTPRFREPYVPPASRISYDMFRSLTTTYRPGVGRVVGENAELAAQQNAPDPEESRGYWDPELGWIATGTDPETGEPFAAPQAGPSSPQTPGQATTGMEPTSATTAITPTGQVLSPNAAVAQVKYETAVANARNDLLREREQRGLTAPLTNLEERGIQAEAERRATQALNAYVGGNPNNSPMPNPLDPDAIAELKEGQFLPQFTGYSDVRPLTAQEAANINFLRGSDLEGKDQAVNALLDPMVSMDQKASILGQINGIRTAAEREATTVQDQNGFVEFLGSWWNPMTWGPRIALSGLQELGDVYNDYIIPSYTWSASALPGGPRTATWEQAQREIAPGDMTSAVAQEFAGLVGGALTPAVTGFKTGNYLAGAMGALNALNPAAYAGKLAGDTIYNLSSGYSPTDSIGMASLGAAVDPGADPSALMPWATGNPNDVYSPAFRQRVFEENPIGSSVSGTIGVGVAVVWDPLVVVGPVGKFVRVSHRLGMGAGSLTRSGNEMRKFQSHLDLGQMKYLGYDEARKALDEARLSGDKDVIARAEQAVEQARAIKNKEVRGFGRGTNALTKFGDWILDPKSGRPRTVTEILRHSVVRGMPNAAEFALALTKARTFEEYSLIMRAQAGDLKAVAMMRVKNAELADEISYLTITRSADNAATSPEDFVRATVNARKATTNAITQFKAARGSVEVPEELLSGIDDNIARLGESIDSARLGTELGVDAAARDRLWREIDAASDALEEMVFGKPYASWDEATREAYRNVYSALQRERALSYADSGIPVATAADRERVITRLAQLRRENLMYDTILKSEAGLLQNRVNFGIGNVQTLAKWREAARQVRAERQAFQAGSHGSGFRWIKQTFEIGALSTSGKVTVWGAATGAKRVVADALTRPFTYAAMESPAGYITLKGFGGSESYREIAAIGNRVRFYGWDTANQAKKDRMIARYTRMLNDPNLSGLEVIQKTEKTILTDMAVAYLKKYGLDTDTATVNRILDEMGDVYAMYDARRAELINSIRYDSFWVDEAGELHQSPFIESQLIDSMPMMDFRRMERLMDGYIKQVREFGPDRINVGRATRDQQPLQEGVIRAAERRRAATSEVAVAEETLARLENLPFDVRAARASSDELSAQYVSDITSARATLKRTKENEKRLKAKLDEAIKMRDETIAAPGNFQKMKAGALGTYDYFESMWRAAVLLRVGYPVRNTMDGLARRFAFEASVIPMLQDATKGVRNTISNVREGRNVPLPTGRARDGVRNKIADKALREMEKTGKVPRRVARWVKQERGRLESFRDNQRGIADYTQDALVRLRAQRASVAPEDLALFDANLYEVERNIRLLDASVADINRKIARLDTDSATDLVSAFRQSLDRPRRVGQEMVQGVDGRTYWGARSDPNMGDIMEQAASAGETVQATLGLNLNISRSLMNAARVTSGGRVGINSPNYYSSMTEIVNKQIRNSLAGRMWLSGASVDEIAVALMDPAQGGKYQQMIARDSKRASKARGEDAAQVAEYEARAAKAVQDDLEEATGIRPTDIGRLETDVDRSLALVRGIDVPGYGRVDEIMELVEDAGGRSIRMRLRGPQEAPPGAFEPNDGGWTNISWQIAPASERPAGLARYPAEDLAIRTPGETPTADFVIASSIWDGLDAKSAFSSNRVQPEEVARRANGQVVVRLNADDAGWLTTRLETLAGQVTGKQATAVNKALERLRATNIERPNLPEQYGESLGAPGNMPAPRITARRDGVYWDERNSAWMVRTEDGYATVISVDRNGDRLLTLDEIPDTVYHITTNFPAIERDGIIRVSGSSSISVTGLGSAESGVLSVTGSREIAEGVAKDMMFYAAVLQTANSGEDAAQVAKLVQDELWSLAKAYRARTNRYPKLKKDMQADFDKITDAYAARIVGADRLGPAMNRDEATALMLGEFFEYRQRYFGIEDPIFASKPSAQQFLDPTDIRIIEIPKSTIPENAVIRDNGFNKKIEVPTGENGEIQIFADLPLSGKTIFEPEIVATRRAGYLPPTPALEDGINSARASAGVLMREGAGDELAIQAVIDSIRAQGYGLRVSLLKDGKTLSIGLPRSTEGLRQESLDRVRRAASGSDARSRGRFDEFDGGVEMVHTFNRIDNIDDATLHAEHLVTEFERYIPDETLRSLLNNGPVQQHQIEKIYANNPASRAALPDEIHGAELTIATGVGSNPASEFLLGLRGYTERVTASGFRKLGTIPEDRMVRLPFMARRYEDTLVAATRAIAETYPDGVPAWAVDWAIQAARKRAVKDTNDYFYTQPRRTNFGRVMERYIPFVSAWQNSGMAMSKLIATNPEVALYFEKAWMLPDQIGIEDSEGNIRIPIPQWLVGRSMWAPVVGEIPLTGVYGDEWVYDKKSAYVIPQQVDPLLSLKSGPAFQMTASTIMQAGWAGPVVPEALRITIDNALGDGSAQKVWDAAVLSTFGIDEFGRDEGYARAAALSDAPFGADRALPPAGQKIVDVVQASFGNSPNNSRQYATAYLNIARDEMLKWLRGERDVPTMPEIKERANGLFFIRGMTNMIGITGGPLGAVTPPQADFEIQGFIDLYRQMQDLYGYDGADEAFMSLFGDEVTSIVRSNSSRGVSPATTKSLARAEKYQGLLSTVGPRIEDTGLLAFALTDGTETQEDFNPNVRVTQLFRDVPGASDQMRTGSSPEESIIDGFVSSGWTAWIKFKESQQAELDARGLGSLQSNGAEDLREDRRAWLRRAEQSPIYRDWYAAYNDGFANRNLQARDFLRAFTGNEKWMEDKGAGANPTDMWITAQEWTKERDEYYLAFQRAGDNETARGVIRDMWLERSTEIARTNPRFQEFWVRFLDEDDLTSR